MCIFSTTGRSSPHQTQSGVVMMSPEQQGFNHTTYSQTAYPPSGYQQTTYSQAANPPTVYQQTGYSQAAYPQTGYQQESIPLKS